jgi:hypothetical protein
MTFFSEVMRGYRAGRAARAGNVPPSDVDVDDDNGVDELAELERKIAGELATMQGKIAELLTENASLIEENARLKAQRAPGQDQRDRARMRELESILAFPGVRTALVKTLHPDTGTGGSTATRTEIFQTLMAVMERLGIRG